MAAVIKLANLLQKHKQKEEVQKYISEFSDWQSFVDGELDQTNKTYNRSLGGQQPRSTLDDDEGDSSYETNMEKIMARFANFNNLSSNESNDDDDNKEEINQEIEEDNNQEDDFTRDRESPQKDAGSEIKHDLSLLQDVEHHKLQETLLEEEYMDNNYWNKNLGQDSSIDDLMADYE